MSPAPRSLGHGRAFSWGGEHERCPQVDLDAAVDVVVADGRASTMSPDERAAPCC